MDFGCVDMAWAVDAAQHAEDCHLARSALDAQYKPPRKLVAAPRAAMRLWSMPAEWRLTESSIREVAGMYDSSQYSLLYDWRRAYFTDGSVQATEDGQLVGAAVWRATGGTVALRAGWFGLVGMAPAVPSTGLRGQPSSKPSGGLLRMKRML